MKRYQVTLVCANGKYKPVSAIVNDLAETMEKKEILKKGIENICFKRMWTSADLKKFGYTQSKMRIYDPVKIEAENKARYEKIKEEKYASGEWKRPRKEV